MTSRLPLAILVVDIRRFSHLVEEYEPDQAARLIEEFATIIEELVERVGGTLIHIWADQAFVRFRTPAQAVRAAVELHKRYKQVVLPGGTLLSVGIGIAAGEVVWVRTGYVGRVVSRAEQLCALAGPGQTLVDERVREMIPQMYGVRLQEHVPGQSSLIGDCTQVLELVAAS